MSYEEESARLGDEYRAALKRAQNSDAFWNKNPIAYAVAPGDAPPQTSMATLVEAASIGTPNSAWRAAMSKLAEWQAYRAAHGHA